MAALLVAVLAACTPSADVPSGSGGTDGPSPAVHPLPTATSGDGQAVELSVQPAAPPVPFDIPGQRAGQGFDIEPVDDLGDRLELVLPASRRPSPNHLPVAGHFTDGGWQWEPAVFDDAAETFTVTATGFSVWIPVWAPIRDLIADQFDNMADYMTGHTDPPKCSGDAPDWADLVDFSTPAVHTCFHDPQGDGNPELLIKSNRGSFLIVTIPLGVSYVWVEGQPDWLRPIMASVSNSGKPNDRVVVLPPGKRVSFGWRRPPRTPLEATTLVYTTNATVGLSAAWWAVDAAGASKTSVGQSLRTIAIYRQCTTKLFGFDPVGGDVEPDPSNSTYLTELTKCAFSGFARLTDPKVAVGAVYDLWGDDLIKLDGPTQRQLAGRLAFQLTTFGRSSKVINKLLGGAQAAKSAALPLQLTRAIAKSGDAVVDAALGPQTATVTLTPPDTASRCEDAPESAKAKRVSSCLYDAWRAGDREAAMQVAWPDVVDELFSRTPGPEWELVGCDTFSCEFVEPTPDDVDGARIRFGVAPDVDGDGLWYVGRLEISEGAPESAGDGTMRYTGPPLSPGESWIDSDGFIWVGSEDGTPVNMGQGQ